MKHLIKDTELMAYLEGSLTKNEIQSLKKRIEENGELDMLYHLQLSYNKGIQEYADFLLGKDDFVIGEKQNSNRYIETCKLAADKFFPEKKD